MLRSHYSAEISPEMDGAEVTLSGWLREIRDLGRLKFAILADREGSVQLTVKKGEVPEEVFSRISGIPRESVVKVVGTVRASGKAPGGFEIVPSEVELIARSETPLPLEVTGKTPAELPTRLNARFLDLRRPEISAIFRIESAVKILFLECFDRLGFVNVNVPCIVAAATEGGAELFPLAYFDREAFLSQSPQLYKQILMASGLDRVSIVTPAFRAEPHDTPRHLNEAVQMDIEVAFVESEEDVLKYYDEFFSYLSEHLEKRCRRELRVLGAKPEFGRPERITYDKALDELSSVGIELEWGEDLTPEAERKLCGIFNPVVITKWPTEVRAFYSMPEPDNPKICRGFDLLFNGIEVSSGAQRIHDIGLLKSVLKERNMDVESFEFYLNAFRYGMPPHAGWSIGLERFVMAFLGLKNIREASLFPRDRKRLVP